MADFTIDSEFVAKHIPPRRKDSHKRMNGVACIVGGSRVYHGAPFLAAMAAMRTGIDLVYLAVPGLIASPVRALSPDIIVFPLPDGKLTRGATSKLVKWLPDVDCAAIGPGLGQQNEEELVASLERLATKTKKMVLDADALRPKVLSLSDKVQIVVTPHAGEFERLFGTKLGSDTSSRSDAVKQQAESNHLTVLLKGPTDIVSDGSNVGLNTTHTPSMTVGGTGDVLTGITAGLLAKGLPSFEGACCAVFINGSAGLEATEELGLHIVASDVVSRVAFVMKQFDQIE